MLFELKVRGSNTSLIFGLRKSIASNVISLMIKNLKKGYKMTKSSKSFNKFKKFKNEVIVHDFVIFFCHSWLQSRYESNRMDTKKRERSRYWTPKYCKRLSPLGQKFSSVEDDI